MTFLVERLAELRRHLDHLYEVRTRVRGAASLRRDLSLHNDVLASRPPLAPLVNGLPADLGARRGHRFEDYTEAVRNLAAFEQFPGPLVERLVPLPGFRNVLIHQYVALDFERVLEALSDLTPIEEFYEIVAGMASAG